MLNRRGETIFVNLLLFYGAGVFFTFQYPARYLQHTYAICTACLLLILLILNFSYGRLKIYRFKYLISSLLYLLIFFIGGWYCLLNIEIRQPHHFARKNLEVLKIIVDEAPQTKDQSLRFKATILNGYIKKKEVVSQGRLMVTLQTAKSHQRVLNYGDVLLIPASYKTITGPQNPSEFNYKAWLATQNIHHQVYLKEQQAILIRQRQGHPLIAYALNLRERQIDQLKALIHNEEAFAVASTLILGYRADLSKETLDAYSKTGTIHALSVSGMHVGIIYVVLMWLFTFMERQWGLKIIRALLIISLIWFYALLTGFSPSVLRAAIMLSTYIVAKTWSQRTNSYNILAFSAFVLLIYQPLLLFDVGFQLSYLAVFGLIYLQPLLHQLLYFKNNWVNQLWSFTALSVAAQLATFPLSVYYFHQFPVYFLASNLFIVVPATLMMYIGLTMLLFKFYFLAPALEWIIIFTNKGLLWIANLPYSTISAIWWSKTELILVTGVLILITLAFQKRSKKSLFVALSLLIVLQSIFNFRELSAYQQQKLIVFKLRKNYAVAYIQSNTAVVYMDITPKSKTFLYSVKPCLDQHRITKIQFKIDTPVLKKIKHL